MTRNALAAVVALWALLSPQPTGAAPRVELASGGKAKHSVITSLDASDRVRQAARTLAEYLSRMSGARFEVASGAGESGIVVGTVANFPRYADGHTRADQPIGTEDYLLRSHANGVFLIGASDLAVEHAIWDLLYRLGYRQFFPGDHWEIVPNLNTIALEVDSLERPDYYARRIWYGFGAADYAKQSYEQWCARNRATAGIQLNTGHSYDQILSQHKQTFLEHPEYLALVDGKRQGPKFCLSNERLRKLVIDHKFSQVAENPLLQSVSIDPSDGGGWCECKDCQRLGSVTDQAVGLGNDVAAALEARYGDKFVGMYAYNYHAPPPAIRVHPKLVVSIATAFIKGDYPVDQLMSAWQKQGATLGVREYLSVNTWDRDLPGQARGASRAYVSESIPHFQQQGARFYSAESSDNWGCNGLGYYLASRILWNVDEAQNVDDLVNDFLEKSFGRAKEPMSRFYLLIDGSPKPLLSDDLLGRMYRALAEARSLESDADVQKRLHDLVLYTRYAELYSDYSAASGAHRQQAFERLLRHAYRMRKSMLVHTMALYRDLANRDKSVTLPQNASWSVAEGENPWKSSEPFTESEIATLIDEGIARRALLTFSPVAYSSNLVPAKRLGLTSKEPGKFGILTRGDKQFFTWMDAPGTLKLKVTAGLVYANQGPAKLSLFSAQETLGNAVAHAEIAGTKEPQSAELATQYAGLQRVELSDRGKGTNIEWPEGTAVTVPATKELPASFSGRWTLYFYVPKGTKVVAGYASPGAGDLLDADGQKIFTFGRSAGYFQIDVPQRQDGRLWKFSHCAGERILMTVPPYLARSASELLLPQEVVESDAPK